MDPIEVAASYDRLAERWNGPAFNRKRGMRQHERALTFITRFGTALDVGCGSSGRIIDLLITRGFRVEGLDVSAEMLRLARLRHPQILFHHADIVCGLCQDSTISFPRLIVFGMFLFHSTGMFC